MASRFGLFDFELDKRAIFDPEVNKHGNFDPDFSDETSVAPASPGVNPAISVFRSILLSAVVAINAMVGVQTNLLVSTLTPAPVQAPFYQVNWPNPRVAAQPVDLKTFTNPTELQLIGKDNLPTSRQLEWNNPVRAIYVSSNNSFSQSPTLLGQEVLPERQLDWVNPLRARSNQPDLPSGLTLNTLGVPRLSIDWPNPLRPKSVGVFDPVNLLNSTLTVAVVTPPFIPVDWQNPFLRLGFRAPTHVSADMGPGTPTPPVGTPFFQTEWPNPTRGLKAPVSNLTFIYYYVQDDAYQSGLTDQPNPRGYTYPVDLRTWSQSRALYLPAPSPFFTTEWPNPRGPVYPTSLRTHLDLSRVYLKDTFFGVPGQPPATYEWPVPRGKVAVIDLKTGTCNLLESTLYIPPVVVGAPDIIIVDGRLAKHVQGIIYIFL